MTKNDFVPIACTLSPGAHKVRLASIADLNRDALRHHARRDLELRLAYAASAAARVHEMVRAEQACCAFLTFDLDKDTDEVRLTITAPERAREVADELLGQFLPSTDALMTEQKKVANVAGTVAITAAAGAVACGACCVLPFALPAAAVAGFGGVLSLFAGALFWVTALAVMTVAAAWTWVGWQSFSSGTRPAPLTLYTMGGATALTAVALLWHRIESVLIHNLRG
jgi:hypothetical protein